MCNMEATIHVPEDFGEAENCFIVNFTNGQLLPSAAHKPKFTLYEKAKDRTKKRRVMVAETSHLSYVGSNYDPDSAAVSAAATCRYCIGAFDRESGTMTLHRAQQFLLKPHIPGKTDIGVDDSAAAEQQTPSKTDYRKSVDKMVNLFGSEKQKRAFSAAKRNVVDEGELDAALATAVSHIKKEVEDVASESQSMQSSGLMPPHNPSAETPQDVYNMEDIISLGEFRVLKKAAKVFVKSTAADIGRWRDEKRYPEYVLQHIHLLPTKDPQRSLKAAMLLYASFLIKMHNMSSKALEKEGLQFEGVSVPVEVKEQLLLKFSERQEGMGKHGKTLHTLSQRMKDKIRLHLFVLTLMVDDFMVDCRPLQLDLKLTTTKVMDHFRALGCVVTKTAVKRKHEDDDDDLEAAASSNSSQPTSSCTAVLKIPLNFPNPKRGKRRN